MKTMLILFIGILNLNCFAQITYNWEELDGSSMINEDNAETINNYENTPISIVTYFYASRIRGDYEWEKVLPPEYEKTQPLVQKFIIYEGWNFTFIQLLSMAKISENEYWFKVLCQTEYNRKIDKVIDQIAVELIDGNWIITGIPS